MENYTNELKTYLNGARKINKEIYMVVGTIYRAVTKGRVTVEQGVNAINLLGGTE